MKLNNGFKKFWRNFLKDKSEDVQWEYFAGIVRRYYIDGGGNRKCKEVPENEKHLHHTFVCARAMLRSFLEEIEEDPK